MRLQEAVAQFNERLDEYLYWDTARVIRDDIRAAMRDVAEAMGESVESGMPNWYDELKSLVPDIIEA